MRWTWSRFEALAVTDLHDALSLRARVFVVEQRCAFQDPDPSDRTCWHLLGRSESGALAGSLAAYLRVVDPFEPGEAPWIGRVITAPEVRGTGAGRELMAEGLRRCLAAWPGRGVRLNAQAHLEPFYAGFGFRRDGANFIEDDIPHVPMWRSP